MKVIIKTNGVLPPLTKKESINLNAVGIVGGYKGLECMQGEKLKRMQTGFNERGMIKFRGHERMVFSTGLSVEEASEVDIILTPNNILTRESGLIVLTTTVEKGPIEILILNPTPHLINMKKGTLVATIEFKYKVDNSIVEFV